MALLAMSLTAGKLAFATHPLLAPDWGYPYMVVAAAIGFTCAVGVLMRATADSIVFGILLGELIVAFS